MTEKQNQNRNPPKTESKDPPPKAETKKTKRKRRPTWDRIVDQLPVDALAASPSSATAACRGPERAEYAAVEASIPLDYVEMVDQVNTQTVVGAEHAPEPRWCLCEQPDGEFPKVRMFQELEDMARYMGRLEGDETAIWAFYGIPMRFTAPIGDDKIRYLFLPGEEMAVSIPKSNQELMRTLDADDVLAAEPDWQEDGWIGDPALSEAVSESYYKKDKTPAEEDDEFDDDGDDDDDQDHEHTS